MSVALNIDGTLAPAFFNNVGCSSGATAITVSVDCKCSHPFQCHVIMLR